MSVLWVPVCTFIIRTYLLHFIDIIVAARLKFELHMLVSRPRKSILFRDYDIST